MVADKSFLYALQFLSDYPDLGKQPAEQQVQTIKQFLEKNVPSYSRIGFLRSLSNEFKRKISLIQTLYTGFPNAQPHLPLGDIKELTLLMDAVSRVANEINNNGHSHEHPSLGSSNNDQHDL